MAGEPGHKGPGESSRLSRTLAGLVLVPTVPLLLISVALLAVFYAAPGRFGNILARLPGDEFLRAVLIFAPVTLFAVVVLAILYALEPATQAGHASRRHAARPGRRTWTRAAAWLGMLVSFPGFLLALAISLLSFVAPGRLSAALAPLPGDRFLAPFLAYAPIAPLLLLIPSAAHLLLAGARAEEESATDGRPARLGVALTLLSTLPLFFLSMAALALFTFSPSRFVGLVERVSLETFLRLALVLAPIVFFSLVALAGLYLLQPRMRASESGEPEAATGRRPRPGGAWRGRVAVWVLTLGLSASSLVALGLLGAAGFLILR